MAVAVAIVSSNNGFIYRVSSSDALRAQANPGPGSVGRTMPLGTQSHRPSPHTTVCMASHGRRLKRRDRPVNSKIRRATVVAGRRVAWSLQELRRTRICAT